MVAYTIGPNGTERIALREARIAIENAGKEGYFKSGSILRLHYTGSKDLVVNKQSDDVPNADPFID